jgi:mRNA-degrading endonuclease RelE of RelBE toxin-antitoxin system
MSFNIIATEEFRKAFKKLAKRYRSLANDFKEFTKSLAENPFQGDELTPGVRKIRLAITSKGKGKSGGARVITYTITVSEESGDVYLIDLYDKSDYSTVLVSVIKDKIDGLNL